MKKLRLLPLLTAASLMIWQFDANAQLPTGPFVCGTQKTTAGGTTPLPSCMPPQASAPLGAYPSHTPIKYINVKFHFMLKQGSTPGNLTEINNGLPNANTAQNGYEMARLMVEEANLKMQSVPYPTRGTGSGSPHDARIRYVIDKDPLNPNDKGVYFHRMNMSNPEDVKDYTYIHNRLDTLKTRYSVRGADVIDIFIQESPSTADYGGYAVHAANPKGKRTAMALADLQEAIARNERDHHAYAQTLTHEFGHLVGLDHSFELIDDDCLDTDPTGSPCATSPYDNNLMSYCGDWGLSECQLGKMHTYLMDSLPGYWLNDYCDFNPNNTITVENGQHLTWTGSRMLNGNLVIKKGAHLTISGCTVSFPAWRGGIIIEPGGVLIVDGAKLTSACDQMWAGIQVQGNPNLTQQDAVINIYGGNVTTQNQGVLLLKNNAVIERAFVGVRNCASWWLPTQGINDNWPQVGGNAGGIIVAENAIFRNNRKCVELFSYHSFVNTTDENPYRASFTNCTFAANDIIKHPGYITSDGRPYGTDEFVTAWDVQNIMFINCSFKQELGAGYTPAADIRGEAIGTLDAKIILDNCNFENLTAGVNSTGSMNVQDYTVIRDSKFKNTFAGVTTNSIKTPVLFRSEFTIPEAELVSAGGRQIPVSSWGMFINKSGAFRVGVNSFYNTESHLIRRNLHSYGMIINQSGNEFGFTTSNVYANAEIGLQWEMDNLQSQADCNKFRNNNQDWYVNPWSDFARLGSQGDGLATIKRQADNLFTKCDGSSGPAQIRSFIAAQPYFTYYSNTHTAASGQWIGGLPGLLANFHDLLKLPCTDKIDIQEADISRPEPSCPRKYDIAAYKTSTPLAGEAEELLGRWQMAAPDPEKTRLGDDYLLTLAETGRLGEALTFLQNADTYSAHRTLATTCLGLHQFTQARGWLNLVASANAAAIVPQAATATNTMSNWYIQDHQDFLTLYNMLIDVYEAGRNELQLTGSEQATIDDLCLRDNYPGWHARGIRKLYSGVRAMPVPEELNEQTFLRKLPQANAVALAKGIVLEQNVPNPATGTTTIGYRLPEGQKGTLVLYTMHGMQVASYPLAAENHLQAVQVGHLTAGVYYYVLLAEGRMIGSRKMVIQ